MFNPISLEVPTRIEEPLGVTATLDVMDVLSFKYRYCTGDSPRVFRIEIVLFPLAINASVLILMDIIPPDTSVLTGTFITFDGLL